MTPAAAIHMGQQAPIFMRNPSTTTESLQGYAVPIRSAC
ncbi:hypothetical protein I545_5332 [Mycobacterium kansasii 662]|uniref:Uncharacterized protein n=2 Tax=Mycobacterium kansasii TaxID=1768 RepID=A0A1V3WFD7_MYCKA|nr:hypothetical protein I547_1571 [Mycobacterium kansasii 824]EUA11767.1 hypothetical protein I545_5332 [Mycobacterium kansasii 662]KEP43968.1 hypothetical protein MKSMC1_08620 [Mycobacterium kansasii]OOK65693.1 hypothetical protein BZL30_8623 [Mycobacterium kansasii]OOK66983.1 hypothetical protein BZL29_7181 [Mycobacterium kansasii]